MSRLRNKRSLSREHPAEGDNSRGSMQPGRVQKKGIRFRMYLSLLALIVGIYFLRLKILGTVVIAPGTSTVSKANPDLYTYEIVQSYPHDPNAFIQGLVWLKDDVYIESTGLYGKSSLRRFELSTGKILKFKSLLSSVFGEGITIWGKKILELTYQTNQGIVFDLDTFQRIGTFIHNMTDGWGLTNDTKNLIGSDGTENLYFLDPTNYSEVRRIQVKDGGRAVKYLNELEYIDGLVWANIWQTDCIAQISPKTGKLQAWLLLQDLRKNLKAANENDFKKIEAMNGIAWNPVKRKLIVTGKFWPQFFEIIPRKIHGVTQAQIDAARKACIIEQTDF